MKRLALVILTALTLGITGSASAQFGRNYWLLDADTLKVINPNWFIAAQNFIPIVGGTTNLFLGYQSGYSITSGTFNVGLGYRSLYGVTSGSFNTAIGDSAMLFDSTGYYNVAIGHRVLYKNNGDWNVGIGQGALENNTSGTQNVSVGYLTLNANTTGFNEIAIGQGAMSSSTQGSDNLFIGSYAGSAAEGTYNIGIGQNTMQQGGISADSNIAIGINALYSLGNGSASAKNTAIGFNAGGFLNVAYNNVLLGNHVADFLNYGNNNIAIGDRALYGTASTTAQAYSNIAIGDSSLFFARNSLYNVALGHYAGFYDSTGTGNIFLGDSSGYNETGSNKLYIANSSTSSPLVYGDFAGDSIRVNGQLSSSGNIVGYGNATLSGTVTVGGTISQGTILGTAGITTLYQATTYGDNRTRNLLIQSVNNGSNTESQFLIFGGALASTATPTAPQFATLLNYPGFAIGQRTNNALEFYTYVSTDSNYNAATPITMLSFNDSGKATLSGNLSVKGTGVDTLAGTLNTGGYVSTASDQSFTNSTTQTNVTGLSVPLQANTTYSFIAQLFTSVAASAGEATSVYYGGNTPTYVIYGIVAEDNSVIDVSNWTNTIGTPFSDNTGSAVTPMVKVRGTITTGATAANLTIQYAQSTAHAATEVKSWAVKEHSFLCWRRIHLSSRYS